MHYDFPPNRDASPTIAGFVLQVSMTVLRWLELHEGEELHLEAGEDIAIVQAYLEAGRDRESRTLEQIKRSKQPLTLRSPAAVKALADFCGHRARNPEIELRFRFVTTALATRERGWFLSLGGDRRTGLAAWQAIRVGKLSDGEAQPALDSIRQNLLAAPKPDRVRQDDWASFQGVLVSRESFLELIERFEWSVAGGDYLQVEREAKAALRASGFSTSEKEAQDCFDRLFIFTLRKLSMPGHKALTLSMLRGEIHSAMSDSDKALLAAIQAGLSEVVARLGRVETRVATLEESAESHRSLSVTDLPRNKEIQARLNYLIAQLNEVRSPFQGMSLSKLAERLGHKDISTLEAVRVKADPLALTDARKICELSGARERWLLDGEGHPFSQHWLFSRPFDCARALLGVNAPDSIKKKYDVLCFVLCEEPSGSAALYAQPKEAPHRLDLLLKDVPIRDAVGNTGQQDIVDFCAFCGQVTYLGSMSVFGWTVSSKDFADLEDGVKHPGVLLSRLGRASQWWVHIGDVESRDVARGPGYKFAHDFFLGEMRGKNLTRNENVEEWFENRLGLIRNP